ADVGVVLSVVIAERTFVIAEELRNAVVGAQLPVLGERLVDFELHRLVDADRINETVLDAVFTDDCGQLIASRVEGVRYTHRVIAVHQYVVSVAIGWTRE